MQSPKQHSIWFLDIKVTVMVIYNTSLYFHIFVIVKTTYIFNDDIKDILYC